ncbi:unnamed protein product [Rotaria sp. Silwood1]|nr:unnamed protein product [Rotaria sp. Silwood1]
MITKQYIQPVLSSLHYTNYVNNYNDNRNQPYHQQSFIPDQERMAKFQQFIRRYEINTTFASKLRGLDGYEIVFICDDSGSMNKYLSDVSGPYKKAPTRCPTPIVKILRQVLKDKRNQIQERNLLILLATDGQPTDDMGKPRIDELRQCLLRERIPTDRIPVTIIACTGNYKNIQYN